MGSFSVYGSSDAEWPKLISHCRSCDVYHTTCYHLLENIGEPRLFVAHVDNNFVALPLIIRPIEGTELKDCTSCYGFCGPFSNLCFSAVPAQLFELFRSGLNDYFRENGIVTAFSRLHPIIIGDELFNGLGCVRNVKDMVVVDLTIPHQEQVKKYRSSNRSEINQLRTKKGYEVREANSDEDIKTFVDIYHESMKRVGAPPRYFFEYGYFKYLLSNSCFPCTLLLAIKGDEICAGAIFTISGRFMNYHLAGTRQHAMREAPMKLILDEARLLGNRLGIDYLHLGGSVGDSEDDTLFRFKAGFSDRRYKFRLWQYVVDADKYRELNALRGVSGRESNYFPLYRS